jgi:hypothetical protein
MLMLGTLRQVGWSGVRVRAEYMELSGLVRYMPRATGTTMGVKLSLSTAPAGGV